MRTRRLLVPVVAGALALAAAGCGGDAIQGAPSRTTVSAGGATAGGPTVSATRSPVRSATPATTAASSPTPPVSAPVATVPATSPGDPRVPRAEAISSGPASGRRVALTFDADMTPGMLQRLESHEVSTWYNEAVIDVLRETHTPATLFLTGLWAQTYPDVARSLADDPLFEIANHSLEHEAFEPCYTLPVVEGDAAKVASVTDSAHIIEDVTGYLPYYFRFPGGSTDCANAADVALVAGAGEQPVDWSAAGDAFQTDPDAVVQSVLSTVGPGAIIALHLHGSDQTDNAPATDEAIAILIPELRAQGYELVTLGALLG